MAELLLVFAMGTAVRRDTLARSGVETDIVAPAAIRPATRKFFDENAPAVLVSVGDHDGNPFPDTGDEIIQRLPGSATCWAAGA